jgi:hypothetical protein
VVDAQTPVGIKVCVDTKKPLVTLQPLSSAEGYVGVSWIIQDDNLANLKQKKPDTMILEYRAAGSNSTWTRISTDPKPTGQRQWNPETNVPLEVRLRVLDDAGNEGLSNTVTGSTGGNARMPPAGTETGNDPTPPRRTTAEGRRLVNTKKFNLNYEVEDVGKSGLSVVELWSTDGKTWKLHSKSTQPQPPYAYEVELEQEGIFGFTLIARSGVGLGEAPPKTGDMPQVWIETDWTKPKVTMQPPEVGHGIDTGRLTINYTAEDKNLEREASITLSYAENSAGPWTPFARNQDNTGRYVWLMPATVPFQFHVRVEATDRAGNVGSAETSEPVKVDLNRPKARVLTIAPASSK